MAVKKRGLGRGLDALLGSAGRPAPGEPPAQAAAHAELRAVPAAPEAESASGPVGDGTLRTLPVEVITRGRYQPRVDMHQESLQDLANSIREQGVVQPIVVRSIDAGRYEIIAGERRWRAAQRAGQHDVPITVVDANDVQSLEFALIENIQRANLNPMEEASGYLALMDDFNRTQDDVAQIVGKSRPHVANTLRLLKLSEPVKKLVRQGKLSAGHARLLVGQPNAEAIAQETVAKGWSVRQLEDDMRKAGAAQARAVKHKGKGAAAKDADTRALERRLSDTLGLEVSIDHRGKGGTLHIKYTDLDQLDTVLKKLNR